MAWNYMYMYKRMYVFKLATLLETVMHQLG